MSLPPPTLEAPPTNSYTCPYCRLEGPVNGTSCVHCGAPVDIRASVSRSGWEKQPGIKDLARIQFGQSTCQISGLYVPAAEFSLAPGEGVYFGHHRLLWADTQVQLSSQSLKGAWKRQMAGLDIVMMQANGPGRMALADNVPGESIVVPLLPGQAVDVREHRFVMASLDVTYDWFQSNVWYTTREDDSTETHYPTGMFLDRFTAAGDRPGMLMLHGHGNVFVRDLAEGESILLHPGSFLWKDWTVSMNMHLERPAAGGLFGFWTPSTPWLRLSGPGRIAVSSKYEHMEGTGRIVSTSQCTQMDWNRQQMAQQFGSAKTAFKDAKIDDAPFKAALDAYAASAGFTVTAEKTKGMTVSHEYVNGSLAVSCAVSDKSAVSSVASTAVSGLGTMLGNNQAVTKGLGKLMGAINKGPSAEGAPVDGLGMPATWQQPSPDRGVLTVIKGNRVMAVTIVCGAMQPGDQLAWAKAFAAVGLPTV